MKKLGNTLAIATSNTIASTKRKLNAPNKVVRERITDTPGELTSVHHDMDIDSISNSSASDKDNPSSKRIKTDVTIQQSYYDEHGQRQKIWGNWEGDEFVEH